MSAFWHPLSAVYLREPRALASPVVLRLMLSGEGRADLVYAGDRMWPAVRHGQPIEVRPLPAPGPQRGQVVLAVEGGVPEVLRIGAAGEALEVAADADPAPPRRLDPREILGRIDGVRSSLATRRAWARVWLDLVEAVAGAPDAHDDPSGTVRDKYDHQAPHYARADSGGIDPSLRARLEERLPHGARLLVAGSGAGAEVFALETIGYAARGVDFSARMVEAARAEARRRGSGASFVAADLRVHEEPSGCLDAVFFTYDVYSFLPHAAARRALLRRMRTWLVPGGALLLSARRVRGARDVAMLTLQRLGRVARGRAGEWGDSHTRWLDDGGRLRRSFVRVFTDRQLDRETSAAGFRRVSWQGGHGLYEAAS